MNEKEKAKTKGARQIQDTPTQRAHEIGPQWAETQSLAADESELMRARCAGGQGVLECAHSRPRNGVDKEGDVWKVARR